jgi:transposase-like protein
MVASIIRTISAQPDGEHVQKQFTGVTTMLARSHPKVAAMLTDAEGDLLAFVGFARRHWRQIWSTNPLERVNKKIKHQTDAWGVPQPDGPTAPGRLGIDRAALRVGSRRTPLLLLKPRFLS